jgi:hypothetical protein
MQSDYFVLERAGSNLYPLLGWDQSGSAFYKKKPVTVSEPVRLRLGEPIPPKPVMVDHHSLPEPVVSKRLRDVLEPLRLHRTQLIPADVKVSDGDVRQYWLLHVFNEIAGLDLNHSVCDRYADGEVFSIEKLILDEKALGAIPLQERQVFVLAEDISVYLFHQAVVERVMSVMPPPEGLRFIPAAQWNASIGFR